MHQDEANGEGGDPLGARRASLETEHRRLVGLRRAVSGDALDELDPVTSAAAAA